MDRLRSKQVTILLSVNFIDMETHQLNCEIEHYKSVIFYSRDPGLCLFVENKPLWQGELGCCTHVGFEIWLLCNKMVPNSHRTNTDRHFAGLKHSGGGKQQSQIREPFPKGIAQYGSPPCTNHFTLARFYIKKIVRSGNLY